MVRPSQLDSLIRWADVILVEFPWQFRYCRRRAGGAAVVLASHNVERQKFPSWARAAHVDPGRSPWVRYVARAEAHAVARADLIVAVSEADRDLFVAMYNVDPARIAMIPNGADTDLYVPADAMTRRAAKRELGLPGRPTVIYAGANVPPNRDGLQTVRELAAQLEDVTFLVLGDVARADPARQPHLHRVRRRPAPPPAGRRHRALSHSVWRWNQGQAPRIARGGSADCGLPRVVARICLAARAGEHVLVAGKSTAELAEALRTVLADDDLASRLGARGRQLVVDRYSWRQGAADLAAVLQRQVA
jgi:glycosyltransferase involved in cell wall biosynthesis